jgi:hypothetical protein
LLPCLAGVLGAAFFVVLAWVIVGVLRSGKTIAFPSPTAPSVSPSRRQPCPLAGCDSPGQQCSSRARSRVEIRGDAAVSS